MDYVQIDVFQRVACYSHNENPMGEKKQLYHGDNLDLLQRYARDERVDLAYVLSRQLRHEGVSGDVILDMAFRQAG